MLEMEGIKLGAEREEKANIITRTITSINKIIIITQVIVITMEGEGRERI